MRSTLTYIVSCCALMLVNSVNAEHSSADATKAKRSLMSMLCALGNTSFFSTFRITESTLCVVSTVVPSSTPTKPLIDFTRIDSPVAKAPSLPKA